MIKKLLFLIIVPLILCGCTKQTKEEITFSSWGSVSEVKIIKQIISEFEEDNPDVKIKFMHIPQNYFQKLHLLFASNTAPDVIFINNLNIPIYEKYLEDLKNEINPQEFYPQSLEGLSYDKKLLAIPRDISNVVFYINLDLVPMPPKDWDLDEFLKIAQSATKDGKFGVSFEEDIYWALPYLFSFGGGILDNDLNLITETEETKKGLEFYKNLRDKYHVAPTESQVGSSTLAQMFLDKQIAMYLSGRWIYPKISEKADFNWTTVKFPGSTGVPCDCSGWAVSKNSKHKESAKKFVQYLSSQNSSEYFTETGLIVPARIEASKKLENGSAFLESIPTSINTPVSKDYKKIVDTLKQTIEW